MQDSVEQTSSKKDASIAISQHIAPLDIRPSPKVQPNKTNRKTEVKALLTKKTLSTEEHSDLDSPLAPLCSPLTPLVLNHKSGLHNTHREPRERNSSPLQVLSPLTLEFFKL
ncbi:hypothetical protein ACJJTC_018943 [Scirpophaga incertulas]